MIYDIANSILMILVIYQTIIYVNNNIDKFETPQDQICTCKCKDDYGNDKYYYLKNRDVKTVYDPLSPPERRIEARQYPFPNRLFGERTRGEADDYQLLGLLYNTEINKNYQLYGRQTYPGSYEWEYYIRFKDSGGLESKFPLNRKNEIMDGEVIKIPIDNNDYKVSVYQYDTWKYNPFVY
jgi:hypothetical protein